MSEHEALTFLRGACLHDSKAELESDLNKWRLASRVVSSTRRASLEPPKRRPLSGAYAENVKTNLSTQEAFKRATRGDWRLEEVEVENLIAFQPNIDTEYAREISSKIRQIDGFLMRSCLPLGFQQNIEVSLDGTGLGVSFSSFSPKLVFGGIQVTGIGESEVTISGRKAEQPGALFLVGTQANYVQVAQLGSRLFLKNGYHRAYAAMLAGKKFLPAVFTKVSDFSETGALKPGFFSKERLMSDAPPLLKDFFDDSLFADVKVRSMRKVIRVRVDEFFVPR